MKARGRYVAAWVSVALVLSACAEVGAPPRSGPTSGPTSAASPNEADDGEVRYPVHRLEEAPWALVSRGLRVVEGRLRVRGECLLIDEKGSSRASVAVWPSDTAFRPSASGGAIVDEEGGVLVRVGDRLEAWGGKSGRSRAEGWGGTDLPKRCGEKVGYLLLATIRRNPDAGEPQDTVFYPTHDTIGLSSDVGIAGTLTIQGECLQLGRRWDSLPVWPPGTSFDPDVDGGAIVDEDGEVILRVGERVPYISFANAPEVDREFAEEMAGEKLPDECGGYRVYSYSIIGPFEDRSPS